MPGGQFYEAVFTDIYRSIEGGRTFNLSFQSETVAAIAAVHLESCFSFMIFAQLFLWMQRRLLYILYMTFTML